MFLSRDLIKEEEIFCAIRKQIHKHQTDRPVGIHVSSLSLPLQAYYDTITQTDPDDITVATYFTGNAFEHYFSSTIKSEVGIKSKSNGIWNGIHYEMDFLEFIFDPDPLKCNNKLYHIPIEFKSSSQSHRYKDLDKGYNPEIIDNLTPDELLDNFSMYVDQVKKYMVIEWASHAWIIVFFWNLTISYTKNIAFGKKKPQMRVYKLTLEQNELLNERENMLVTRDLLLEAINHKDPSPLKPCPDWLCKVCRHFRKGCNGTIAHNMTKDPLII